LSEIFKVHGHAPLHHAGIEPSCRCLSHCRMARAFSLDARSLAAPVLHWSSSQLATRLLTACGCCLITYPTLLYCLENEAAPGSDLGKGCGKNNTLRNGPSSKFGGDGGSAAISPQSNYLYMCDWTPELYLTPSLELNAAKEALNFGKVSEFSDPNRHVYFWATFPCPHVS